MTTPTAAQLDRAAWLIKATEAEECAINNLGNLIAAAEIADQANSRARDAATNFMLFPDHLANLPALLCRDTETKRTALYRYHTLLTDMISPPVGPQRKVDFNALALAARPYLLAPFLKLAVNGLYPLLDVERSDVARGMLIYVTTSGVADPAAWQAHLPAISAYLGGNFQIAAHTSTTVTLTRRPALPPEIPFNTAWLKPGNLFLGIDVATQKPHYAPFADLSHFLITGTVGMGKSVAHASIAQSLLTSMDSITHVYAVDPGGIAFNRYRGRHPKFTTHSKPADLWAIAADLMRIMETRENELGPSGREKFTSDFIFLVIDEFPAYATPDTIDKKSDDYKNHQQFVAHIMALGRRGRKSGIRLILTVQEPTDRDISTGLRSVLPGVLAFRTPITAHATTIFGELPGLPTDPRSLARGRALYRDGISGIITHVQFPLIPPPGGHR